MKSQLKWRKGPTIIAAIILILVVAVVAIPFLVDVNRFRPTIEGQMQGALGRPVQIGDLSLSLLAGGIKAQNISIADDPAYSTSPFLTSKSLEVGVDFLPLIFSKSMHVNSITLRDPELRLVRGSAGRWNFSSLGSSAPTTPARAGKRGQPSPSPSSPSGSTSSNSKAANSAAAQQFSIGVLRIVNGRVVVSGSHARPQTYNNVQVQAKNVSLDSVMPFTFEAETPGSGKIKLSGEAGPVNRADAAQTPLSATLNVNRMDLASTGFLDPASGLAGVLDFDGTLKSDGSTAHTQGKLKADKLRVVHGGAPASQPVALDYATDYDLKKQQGTVSRGDIHVGNTVVKLVGNYLTQGENTILHMKLNGSNMPMQDVEGLLPAFGVLLPAGSRLQGGTVSANLSIDGPLERLVTTGPVNISNTKLAGFNFASKLAGMAQLAGVQSGVDTAIQTMSSNLQVAPDGIRADNLNLVLPGIGSVTGNGVIAANNALNFKMIAKLANGGGLLGGLSSLSPLGQSKGGGLPFLVQGTTANPIFLPNFGKALGSTLGSTLGAPAQGAQGLGGMLGGILGKKKPQQQPPPQ
jgi:AsmA protein